MANIDNVTITAGSQASLIEGTGTQVSGTPKGATFSTPEKITLLTNIMIGFGVVSILAMLAMLASWRYFTYSATKEYTNSVNEYHDKRFELLQERVDRLEGKSPMPSPTLPPNLIPLKP